MMGFFWRRKSLLVLVLLGLVGGFAWQLKRPSSAMDGVARRAIEDATPIEGTSTHAALLVSSHSRRDMQAEGVALQVDPPPVRPKDEHPHPITPEHERIFAENRTIQALNDSMAFRDVRRMRELLSEYRKLDPADVEATQAGYAVVADCIEAPGPASLKAASHFYDTERHSPLRRFVRRICFENAD